MKPGTLASAAAALDRIADGLAARRVYKAGELSARCALDGVDVSPGALTAVLGLLDVPDRQAQGAGYLGGNLQQVKAKNGFADLRERAETAARR